MSVQAHESSYCTPRVSNAEKYTAVEVGFPNEREPMLMEWCEDVDDPTGTVYGYVPVQVITDVIVKHGGLVEGEIPPGVIAVPALK
tara:strand:+ start:11299 stop:11556 length:258 start_codon:yes stop_codon:yes gene_type:complete